MKNRRGEIATLLTLGLVLIGTAVTIATSFITNNQKNIASNPRAAGTYSCCKVYDTSSACGGGKRIVNMGNAYTSTCAANAMVNCSSVGGPTTSGASICPAQSGSTNTGGLNYGSAKTCSNNSAITYYQIGSRYYKSRTDTAGTTSLSSICVAPAAASGTSGQTGGNELCCKLYACKADGTRQVTVVGFTGVKENGAVGYTSCNTTGYTNVQQCSTIPGAPTTNGATGSVSYGCSAPAGGTTSGGVDPGVGGGGQQSGGATTPGAVGYCCLVYKQGLYASQYGCSASQYAAKVVGFTGVKEDGTAGYTNCGTTGYEKYSGTYKVDDCANLSGAEPLAAAGTGSICIGDPDTPPYIEPEEPAGPGKGEEGGQCYPPFSNIRNMTSSYGCNSPLVPSSQNSSCICQKATVAPVVDTCTPQNNKNDGYQYGCFRDLYNNATQSCDKISGQPGVYKSASGFQCNSTYVCCRKPTTGSGGGGQITNQCSALTNCPGSTTKKYVTGVQTATATGTTFTQFYPDVANCNSKTGGKNAITDICGTSGGVNPPLIPPAGNNPPLQPYSPQGTCKTTSRILHFGTDCSYDEFANPSQQCSNTTPVSGVKGTGCSIFRVCPPDAAFAGDSCKYDCYQNNKKYNCGGTDTEYGRNNDANRLYDVIHVSNKTTGTVEITEARLEKMRLGSNMPYTLGNLTLTPGQYGTYDLNKENFTCNNISLNSMKIYLTYNIKFNNPSIPDIIGATVSGQDGCGGGVKILINITQ